ncbi:hypothetical protein STEG23_013940, partial [Scotinomys teguina]
NESDEECVYQVLICDGGSGRLYYHGQEKQSAKLTLPLHQIHLDGPDQANCIHSSYPSLASVGTRDFKLASFKHIQSFLSLRMSEEGIGSGGQIQGRTSRVKLKNGTQYRRVPVSRDLLG